MINHSGKVQRRDPSVPWHKTCWRQRYSWHPQTLKRVSLPLKGWVPSSPASALLRMEESITVQHRAAFSMVSSSPTHRVTVGHWGGRISAWVQTRDVDQENALQGFFFFPCDYRHIEILWENDAVFSHYRKKSTARSSVIGVSKPHFQRQKFSHL